MAVFDGQSTLDSLRKTKSGRFVFIDDKYYVQWVFRVCEHCQSKCLVQYSSLKQNKKYFCDRTCRSKYFTGKNSPSYGVQSKIKGIPISNEHKRKISQGNKGRVRNDTTKAKISNTLKNKSYKRYYKNGVGVYDTYQPQLHPYGVECRRSPDDKNALEVKCWYCGKWYQPNIIHIQNKIRCIKEGHGERNLYCSDGCKYSCSTYNQSYYSKDHKPATSREVQPQLRKLVLERDNYTCQKCGRTDTLHCHHIDPVKSNPIESADVDICITLCIDCHKEAHDQDGCRYNELRGC